MTLIVIDMQPLFVASNNKRLLRNCTKEIENTMTAKQAVILVEYLGYGSTHQCLLEMLVGYSRFQLITKDNDDGSDEVINCVKINKLKSPFRICGVNLDWCVKQTATSLAKKLPRRKVHVVQTACAPINKKYNWNQFTRHKNIQII
jgi:hypothetical protein